VKRPAGLEKAADLRREVVIRVGLGKTLSEGRAVDVLQKSVAKGSEAMQGKRASSLPAGSVTTSIGGGPSVRVKEGGRENGSA